MASRFSFNAPTLVSAVVLCTALACGPKADDGGDDSSSGGSTTTGEGVTSSDSDPTSPGSSPNPTGSGSATTTTTAASTTGMTTDEPGTATSTSTGTSATLTVTSDSDEPPPVEPPVPCAGTAAPLVDVETIAFLKSQIPRDPNPTGTSGSSGGSEPDPATLYVRLSDQTATCSDPQGNLSCGPHWSVLIAIPPEFQAPGLFNLLGQDVSGSASETGPDGGGGGDDCVFGGGSFAATFEILAIDDTSIEGRLCNVDDFFSFVDPQLEGTFVAPRGP